MVTSPSCRAKKQWWRLPKAPICRDKLVKQTPLVMDAEIFLLKTQFVNHCCTKLYSEKYTKRGEGWAILKKTVNNPENIFYWSRKEASPGDTKYPSWEMTGRSLWSVNAILTPFRTAQALSKLSVSRMSLRPPRVPLWAPFDTLCHSSPDITSVFRSRLKLTLGETKQQTPLSEVVEKVFM